MMTKMFSRGMKCLQRALEANLEAFYANLKGFEETRKMLEFIYLQHVYFFAWRECLVI
jgi:hypothetical protein